MKHSKSVSTLIAALLFTSIGAYAQPTHTNNTLERGHNKEVRGALSPKTVVAHSVRINNRSDNRNNGRNNYRGEHGNHNQSNHRPERPSETRHNNRGGVWFSFTANNYRYREPVRYQPPAYHYQPQYQHQYIGYQQQAFHSRGQRFEVENWRHHHQLYEPPHGTRWMVDGNDFVLAAITTGIIYSIIHM